MVLYISPPETDGIIIYIRIEKNKEFNETVYPIITSSPLNEEIFEQVNNALSVQVPNIELESNLDLNTYTTVGQYSIPSTDIATSLLNAPDNFANTGILIVNYTHDTNNIIQTIFDDTGAIWSRHIDINTNTPTQWINLAITVDSNINMEPPVNKLVTNADLNDYTTPGRWSIPTQAISKTLTNVPTDFTRMTGSLTVLNTHNDNHVIQLLITNDSVSPWIRHMTLTSDTYDPWTNITYYDKNTTLLEVPAEKIPSEADLNDYTAPGRYAVVTQAIATTINNIPYRGSGSLLVFNNSTTSNGIQIFICNHTLSSAEYFPLYIRYFSSAGFTTWNSAFHSDYSWKLPNFLIHQPREELKNMKEVFKTIFDIDITSTTYWAAADENGKRINNSAKVHELWDNLQAQYPQYIDEGEIIGYSLDPNGDNYMPIKAYYIHPRLKYTSYSGTTINIPYDNLPTLYITAGTHGGECSPVYVLFEIFRRAFLTDTIYSSFLTGMQFRIIPVLDCWSYDNYKRYLAPAYNLDGTTKEEAIDTSTGKISELYDANRQCICSDMANPSYETLQLHDFATEAKALTDYLHNYNFAETKGDSYLDLHNCSYSLGYLATNNSVAANMYNIMVDALSKDWHNNTTFADGAPVDYYESNTTDHTKARGKILARSYTEKTYAWFFGEAYNPMFSTLHESQQSDSGVVSSYALAKALDITYRWMKCLIGKIQSL